MLVTVARTEMAPEAHILRGRLEAEGIPAFVQHEHHVTLDWFISNALGGVRLQMPVEHAQAAIDVLKAVAPLIAVVTILQFTFVHAPVGLLVQFAAGVVLAIAGMLLLFIASISASCRWAASSGRNSRRRARSPG